MLKILHRDNSYSQLSIAIEEMDEGLTVSVEKEICYRHKLLGQHLILL